MSSITTRRWQLKYPEKYQAQRAVHKAINNGTLIKQPCEICKSNNNIHAHHDDYSKQLEVRWLCSNCHSNLHNKILSEYYKSNRNPLIPEAIQLKNKGLSYGQIAYKLGISRSQVYKWINNPPYK